MDKANSQDMNKENQTPTLCSIPHESKARRGGHMCCVPTCNNNSRNRPDISYHKLPKEPTLRRKWSKLLKTKGLCNPGENNYVCSDHFPGGKKTYENNIPAMLSSETCQPAKRRKLSLYNNYSKTRNLIGQYPCRMRQSCTGNLKVDIASHFTSLLRV